jgi:hypothetical protein
LFHSVCLSAKLVISTPLKSQPPINSNNKGYIF